MKKKNLEEINASDLLKSTIGIFEKTGIAYYILRIQLILLILLLQWSIAVISVYAEDEVPKLNNRERFSFEAVPTDSLIQIDGLLREQAWSMGKADSTFWLHYPVDTALAPVKTNVRILYDAVNIYFGIEFFDLTGNPISQSLERDFDGNFNNSDNLTLVIDPSHSSKSGYYFGINAAGAQADGTITQNGMYPLMSKFWNNKWYAETSFTGKSIVFEIAIPLSILKNSQETSWGLNIIRNDVNRNTVYTWIWSQANKHSFDLGTTGTLRFSESLKQESLEKIIVIPSVVGGIKPIDEEGNDSQFHGSLGVDAKIALTNALNLDVSVLPEYSDVSVDRQYIDFYQFEYYQPEQRTFFLENSDLFTQFGTYDDFSTPPSDSRVKPVYTRRLGMIDGENVPIIYGARLSGAPINRTRIGILSLQTNNFHEHLAQNYFISSFNRSVFSRSTIKGIFTNRNAVSDLSLENEDYNRTGGVEFDFVSENGIWAANGKLHSSLSPENTSDNLFYGGGFSYFIKNFKTQHWFEHVDQNYITDIGFVPRLYHKNTLDDTVLRVGYSHLINKFEKYQYLNNRLIIVMGEYLNMNTYLVDKNTLNEFSIDLGYWAVYSNNYHIVLQGTYKYFDLLVPYDIFNNGNPVQVGSYENLNLFFQFETDRRKDLYFNFLLNTGGFYMGHKQDITFSTVITSKPKISFELNYHMANIDLPGVGNETYHLLGLQPNISFSKNILWTNLLQINTQNRYANFNSILKWRFAPMSDFYVIIKDEYYSLTDDNNYEISLKLTYWLNF